MSNSTANTFNDQVADPAGTDSETVHKTNWWKQWAIEQALKQRYDLIVKELERRKEFYDRLKEIENIRLICTMLMVGFLLIICLWSYYSLTSSSQQQNLHQGNNRKGKRAYKQQQKVKGGYMNGFFLLGWAPADLYFQDGTFGMTPGNSSEFNNCYSDEDEEDMTSLIKYQDGIKSAGSKGQYYEQGEFVDETDPGTWRHFLGELVSMRIFMGSNQQSQQQQQNGRPEFVRPIRDLSQMNVITNQNQVKLQKQNSSQSRAPQNYHNNDGAPEIQLIDVDAVPRSPIPNKKRGSFL